MTRMNAKAELENRRHSSNNNGTMDVAAEALQSLGDNQQQQQQTDGGGGGAAEKEESSAPPTTTEKDEGSAEAADSETAEVKSPEGEAGPSPPKDAANGEQQQVDAAKAEDTGKRYLPEHKKPDAAPTFPEKLMKLMRYAEKQGDDFCVAWMEDGKSFIIRKPDEFTRTVVPKFFKATKFSSFTRKLYRWGFRQVNRGIGPDDPIIFGNEFFVRDGAERMAKMRSVTAAATRKEEQKHATTAMLYGTMPMVGHHGMVTGGKHPLDVGGFDEATHKRMMIEHMYQHKSGVMAPNPRMAGPGGPGGAAAASGYYPPGPGMAMGANGAMSLTSALRPGMGMPPHPHGQMMSQQQPGGGGPPPPGMNPGGYDYMGYPGMQPQYHPGHQQHHPQQQQQQGHPHPPPQGGGGAPGAMGGPHHHQQQQHQHQQQQQHPQGPYNMQAGGGGPYHPQQHQGMPPPPQHQQYPQQHQQQHQQHSQGPPQQQQQQAQHQQQGQGQQQPPQAQQHPQGNPYPNPAATAEIVNAAIAALRYAN